jgi:CBS domain-containing protein
MICPNCGFDNLPGNEVCDNCQHDLTALDRPTGWNRVEKSLLEDKVNILTPQTPITVLPSTTIQDALDIMLQKNIGALLVVDGKGKLLGIFSERDLLKKVAGLYDSYASLPVGNFMTVNPESVSSKDPLGFALHKMDIGGYRHMPIVDEGKPIGVISVRDMLRYITRMCK